MLEQLHSDCLGDFPTRLSHWAQSVIWTGTTSARRFAEPLTTEGTTEKACYGGSRISRKRNRSPLQFLHTRTGTAPAGEAWNGCAALCLGRVVVVHPAWVGDPPLVDH